MLSHLQHCEDPEEDGRNPHHHWPVGWSPHHLWPVLFAVTLVMVMVMVLDVSQVRVLEVLDSSHVLLD